MNYFYGTRLDKRGDVLMTSYNKKSDAEKHAAGAKHEHTVYKLDLDKGTVSDGAEATGVLLRSIIVNKNGIKEGSPLEGAAAYLVCIKNDGRWERSEFSFSTYGPANSKMKELAPYYDAVAVIDISSNQPTCSPKYADELSVRM